MLPEDQELELMNVKRDRSSDVHSGVFVSLLCV